MPIGQEFSSVLKAMGMPRPIPESHFVCLFTALLVLSPMSVKIWFRKEKNPPRIINIGIFFFKGARDLKDKKGTLRYTEI